MVTYGKNFKVHLDGYNFLPYLTGKNEKGPRNEIFYFSDDGDLTALRYNDWKVIFMEQRATGTLQAGQNLLLPCAFHSYTTYEEILMNLLRLHQIPIGIGT